MLTLPGSPWSYMKNPYPQPEPPDYGVPYGDLVDPLPAMAQGAIPSSVPGGMGESLPYSQLPYAAGQQRIGSDLPMSQVPLREGVTQADNRAMNDRYDKYRKLQKQQQGGGGGGGYNPHGMKDMEALLAELRQKGEALAQKQREAAGPMRENLKNLLGTELQYDLTPLASLVDQWTGSNFAQTYKAPESAKERRGELGKLQQGIAGIETAASAAELQAAKDYANGRMDLRKMENDEAYKRAMLGLQQQELGLKAKELDLKAAKGPEIKDSQYQAGLYGKRMEDSNKIMESIYSQPGTLQQVTSMGGAFDRMKPGGFQSPLTKQINQAERNFINATLRRESGSAISDQEFSNAEQQYFPRMNDDRKTLLQKAQNRARAIEGMKLAAGPAWGQFGTMDMGGVGGGGGGGADAEAVAWAKANPQDPRSVRILQMNGVQ